VHDRLQQFASIVLRNAVIKEEPAMGNTKPIIESLAQLENSLRSHSSMVEDMNPVFDRIRRNELSAIQIEGVLAQYSLLPKAIVEFLSTGTSRLQGWTNIESELERNVAEEMGSRTEGLSHYVILENALLRELGIDVENVRATVGTKEFLDSIKSGLSHQSAPYVAGMLYALEASAVPELMIVAKLVNHYARMIGLNSPIALSGMTVRKQNDVSLVNDRYSLNVFFASHLWDFEVGHRKRLALTITEDLPTSPTCVSLLESGFNFVLTAMDSWWFSMSIKNASTDLAYDGCVVTNVNNNEIPVS